MTALKIPDLDLFHHKRSSPSKTYAKRDVNFKTFGDSAHLTKRYEYNDRYIPPHREYEDVLVESNRRILANNRYMSIAQDYLQKMNRIPLAYLEPTPISHRIAPPYIGKPYKQLYLNNISPKKSKRNCQCQHQTQYTYKRLDSERISNNPYKGMHEKHEKPFLEINKKQKILKDPYLVPTFRDINNSKKFQPQQSLPSSQLPKYPLSSQQQSKQLKIDNNFISKKPQIHTLQAQIQTQKNPSIVSNVQSVNINIKRPSKSNVEAILIEQKYVIQSLKRDCERENQFSKEIQNLTSTKDQYIQKSKEILYKLSMLADDQKQIQMAAKLNSEKKRSTIFGKLDL